VNRAAQGEIERIRPELASLCRRFGVERLFVFGSALGDKWNSSTSDLDFRVDYGPPADGVDLFAQQFVMLAELERLLDRPVDLIERKAIRKPHFRQAVERAALQICAR
jgi:predicted nucleotidyltransferase